MRFSILAAASLASLACARALPVRATDASADALASLTKASASMSSVEDKIKAAVSSSSGKLDDAAVATTLMPLISELVSTVATDFTAPAVNLKQAKGLGRRAVSSKPFAQLLTSLLTELSDTLDMVEKAVRLPSRSLALTRQTSGLPVVGSILASEYKELGVRRSSSRGF